MSSSKITPIVMAFLFLSSILASSGCLEETNDEIVYNDNDDYNNDYYQDNGENNNNVNDGSQNQNDDSDGDGYNDNIDKFPNNPNEWKDSDDDGTGDNSDDFPNDECATNDMDDDGKPDSIKENCNTSLIEDDDIDGDGYNNTIELLLGTNPNSPSSRPLDYDRDGIPDGVDDDIDNDGMNNTVDLCPRGAADWEAGNQNYDWDMDGCKDDSEDKDDDNDGINDRSDSCEETPLNEIANDEGCSASQRDSDGDGIPDSMDLCWGDDSTGDSDGDGLCGDNDECSDGPFLYGEEVDEQGCSHFEKPIPWNGGPYATNYMGTSGDFTIPEPIDENLNFTNDWKFKQEWSGKDTYVFVIYNPTNPDSVITWNSANPVGQATELSLMFEKSPDNVHYFFGSYRDGGWMGDVSYMSGRVNAALTAMNEEDREHWSNRVHYIAMDANFLEGSIADFIIAKESPAWFCIDQLQRWQEVGSFWDLNFNQNFSWYRFHFIANEPTYLNFEFGLERELAAMEYHSSIPCHERQYMPKNCIKGESVTLLEWNAGDSYTHGGGWGGGTNIRNVELPENMEDFDSFAIYTYEACADHKGCNEWDFIGYLNAYESECSLIEFSLYNDCINQILPEFTSQELCENAGHRWDDGGEDSSPSCKGKWNRVWKAEVGRYITAYNREGRYISDVTPMLGVLKNENINEFNYWQPNAYGLTIKLFFWNENKEYTPVGAEYLYGATRKFNLDYNNIFGSENPFSYNVTDNTEKVEIVTFFTGHGHSSTDENCAEFCNHQHEFTINGNTLDLLEHPNGGTPYGCYNRVHEGVSANQYGT
ncbi:MAG: peptide-N-glycosidase F-related protein, partial [Candidatus Thermoplasmatota archaeon]|nr:peptide-N-glycosidase F-related protein [Candidatus Thermoplasmatota archaeon]